MAPSLRQSVLSGTILSMSCLRTLPKPLHPGQAPTGWLKERESGVGLSTVMPHALQTRGLENLTLLSGGSSTQALPPPSLKAASRDSTSRALSRTLTTSLSMDETPSGLSNERL